MLARPDWVGRAGVPFEEAIDLHRPLRERHGDEPRHSRRQLDDGLGLVIEQLSLALDLAKQGLELFVVE